jgi:hypothetical protein
LEHGALRKGSLVHPKLFEILSIFLAPQVPHHVAQESVVEERDIVRGNENKVFDRTDTFQLLGAVPEERGVVSV